MNTQDWSPLGWTGWIYKYSYVKFVWSWVSISLEWIPVSWNFWVTWNIMPNLIGNCISFFAYSYHRTLNIDPWALQQDLAAYPSYMGFASANPKSPVLLPPPLLLAATGLISLCLWVCSCFVDRFIIKPSWMFPPFLRRAGGLWSQAIREGSPPWAWVCFTPNPRVSGCWPRQKL